MNSACSLRTGVFSLCSTCCVLVCCLAIVVLFMLQSVLFEGQHPQVYAACFPSGGHLLVGYRFSEHRMLRKQSDLSPTMRCIYAAYSIPLSVTRSYACHHNLLIHISHLCYCVATHSLQPLLSYLLHHGTYLLLPPQLR